MEQKRKIALAALALGLASTGSLLAATQTQAFSGVKDDLAQALATRFNLNATEVQTFLTEQHQAHKAEMKADMEAKMAARLEQAVTDGKITAAQKDLIVAKQAEVRTKMEALTDSDAADRDTAMKAIQDDLKSWAETNGIDIKWIGGGMPMRGHGMGMGPGGMRRGGHGPDGMKPNAEQQPTK